MATATYMNVRDIDMTNWVRAWSSDRMNDRLVDVLERVVAINQPVRPEPNFRQYEGKGDAKYFIPYFEAVVEVNGWKPTAAVLHLWEALRDSAKTAGELLSLQRYFNFYELGIVPNLGKPGWSWI